MTEEERAEFIAKYAPWYVKMPYHAMLQIPAEPWKVGANWREGYFYASQELVQGVVEGRLMPGIQGVAGVFLFRHYLELALKYIVFHARWLKSENRNAEWDEVKDLHLNHSLMGWWNLVKGETKGKLPKAEWDALDTEFVEQCVRNFEEADPAPGWRFRYHAKLFGVDKRPKEQRVPVLNELYIDYTAMLQQMKHVYDVLNAIDVYLVETHGQNAEWEAEMNSW